MVGVILAGLVRLDGLETTSFSLAGANAAVAHALRRGRAFRTTVICP